MMKQLVDLAERAGATFAQTFLAVLTAPSITEAIQRAGVPLHVTVTITSTDALKYGAIAGGYSVAKFLLVKANAYLKSTGE